MEQQKYKKVYLNVTVIEQMDGTKRPISFKWANGRTYEIDRVRFSEPMASTKVGGRGIRYTVMVEGKERYFFDEEGKWFVEVPIIS